MLRFLRRLFEVLALKLFAFEHLLLYIYLSLGCLVCNNLMNFLFLYLVRWFGLNFFRPPLLNIYRNIILDPLALSYLLCSNQALVLKVARKDKLAAHFVINTLHRMLLMIMLFLRPLAFLLMFHLCLYL